MTNKTQFTVWTLDTNQRSNAFAHTRVHHHVPLRLHPDEMPSVLASLFIIIWNGIQFICKLIFGRQTPSTAGTKRNRSHEQNDSIAYPFSDRLMTLIGQSHVRNRFAHSDLLRRSPPFTKHLAKEPFRGSRDSDFADTFWLRLCPTVILVSPVHVRFTSITFEYVRVCVCVCALKLIHSPSAQRTPHTRFECITTATTISQPNERIYFV